jgi:hypothetical protein
MRPAPLNATHRCMSENLPTITYTDYSILALTQASVGQRRASIRKNLAHVTSRARTQLFGDKSGS